MKKLLLTSSLLAFASSLFAVATPASAASVTYSTWANIGPQEIGDDDKSKFTLKVTDGGDVGADGKVLFQFTSVSLAANNLISQVYFNDASGIFKKDTIVTTVEGKGQDKGTFVSTTTFDYEPYASIAPISTSLSTSVNGLNFDYNDQITLPQGNNINLSKPTFGFERSGGNQNSISVGETLGVLIDLADNKNFESVLNALTQSNGLIVAAHIIGYGNLSDSFYYGVASGTLNASTDSAIFYESYGTVSDPNPATRATTPPPPPVPGAAVPEPLTILGAGTAAAFGAAFKRRAIKAKK